MPNKSDDSLIRLLERLVEHPIEIHLFPSVDTGYSLTVYKQDSWPLSSAPRAHRSDVNPDELTKAIRECAIELGIDLPQETLKLSIYDMFGMDCITGSSGQELYDFIHPVICSGRPVELDFSGVRICLTSFFNYAIGQLLKDVEPEDLDRLLTVSNMTPAVRQTYQAVMDNAKRHYAKTEP